MKNLPDRVFTHIRVIMFFMLGNLYLRAQKLETNELSKR